MVTEGNMGIITPTIPINILMKPSVVEHIHIGQNCSPKEIKSHKTLFKKLHNIFSWIYEEILGIEPAIVVHEIKTYPGEKPVRQKICLVHP